MSTEKEPRVLVLVLSSEDSPWTEIQKLGQDATFMGENHRGLRYLRYYGDRSAPVDLATELLIFLKRSQNAASRMFPTRLGKHFGKALATSKIGDNYLKRKFGALNSNREKGPDIRSGFEDGVESVFVPIPELRPLIGLKTLLAFQYVLEHYEFDYLFRTNTSSFVNGQALLKIAKSVDRTNLYAGAKVEIFVKDSFATGSGFLISRDVLEKISHSPELWPLGVADDVSLAMAIKSLPGEKIERIDFPFFHPTSLQELQSLDPDFIRGLPHVRCKSESPKETINLMKYLWRTSKSA
jgi:hypothetical protein